MNTKSSAHYQREYRRRLRAKGLVKKEVWIRPENAGRLSELERELREVSDTASKSPTPPAPKASPGAWTTRGLHEALVGSGLVRSGRAGIELIDGIEPSLRIVMHDYGDLPVFVTVYGDQVLVEAVLWSRSEVVEPAAFNDTVLRTHKYFPLSTISLDAMADGSEYYQMFGALSATSRLLNVVFEIEMLASNVIQATQAYREHLTVPAEA